MSLLILLKLDLCCWLYIKCTNLISASGRVLTVFNHLKKVEHNQHVANNQISDLLICHFPATRLTGCTPKDAKTDRQHGRTSRWYCYTDEKCWSYRTWSLPHQTLVLFSIPTGIYCLEPNFIYLVSEMMGPYKPTSLKKVGSFQKYSFLKTIKHD